MDDGDTPFDRFKARIEDDRTDDMDTDPAPMRLGEPASGEAEEEGAALELGPAQAVKRRRVALMGEFSAGKSTLTNLLLGFDPLPTKITATRLPPIWLCHGEGSPERETVDGSVEEFAIEDLEDIPLEGTRLIRLFLKAEILKVCDLIDMPGISDPNMAPEVWQSVIGEADHVIWCTHSTQAWRQSEAAAWESVMPHVDGPNLLLLTRFDKIVSERDRRRLLARIRSETGGLFSDMYPVALLDALNSGEDAERWKESGAEDFLARLMEMVTKPGAPSRGTYGVFAPPEEIAAANSAQEPVLSLAARTGSGGGKVIPRRVRGTGTSKRAPLSALRRG